MIYFLLKNGKVCLQKRLWLLVNHLSGVSDILLTPLLAQPCLTAEECQLVLRRPRRKFTQLRSDKQYYLHLNTAANQAHTPGSCLLQLNNHCLQKKKLWNFLDDLTKHLKCWSRLQPNLRNDTTSVPIPHTTGNPHMFCIHTSTGIMDGPRGPKTSQLNSTDILLQL